MSSIQSPGLSLSSFQALAKTGEAVALKGGTLQNTTSAKQGFFTRVMNWLRGESSSKINSATKDAFMAAIGKGLTQKGLDNVLRRGGFDAGSSKPLSSREINHVASARNQLLDDAKQLKTLMADMKGLQADIKAKQAVYDEKSKAARESPSEKTWLPLKAAGAELRAARALALAQAEKIQVLTKQIGE